MENRICRNLVMKQCLVCGVHFNVETTTSVSINLWLTLDNSNKKYLEREKFVRNVEFLKKWTMKYHRKRIITTKVTIKLKSQFVRVYDKYIQL